MACAVAHASRLGVRSGKAHGEQMFSASPPEADVTADMTGGPRRAISGLPHRNKLSLKNVGLGDMAWLVLVCTLVSAHAEKRVAVVVGNAAYRYTDKLDNPVND